MLLQESVRTIEQSNYRNINRIIEQSKYRDSEQSSHRVFELSSFRNIENPNHRVYGHPVVRITGSPGIRRPCAMPVRMQQHRLPKFVQPPGLPPSGAGVPNASSAPRHGQGCGRSHMDTGAHQVSPHRTALTQKKGAPPREHVLRGALYHKKGGDLLSHIAVQYHRRARA